MFPLGRPFKTFLLVEILVEVPIYAFILFPLSVFFVMKMI
jgi:hypothetical protein